MAQPLPVLVNRTGGAAAAMGDALGAGIEAAFAEAGREIVLELLEPSQIASAITRHADAPVVVVGGGDGTLGAAAAALVHSTTALAILPLGTRNHLARQLGVPLDLADAARLSVTGQRRRIDLGMAGARIFVNNASFGIYARFVRQREARGGPKWLSSIPAAWHALRNLRAQAFALSVDGRKGRLETPLLFVGNNPYTMQAGSVGERETLNEGKLALYAVAARRSRQLLGFGLRALLGLARPERDFQAVLEADEIVIEGDGWIEGAFDGELAVMALPLRLRSLPGALGVVAPRELVEPARALSETH